MQNCWDFHKVVCMPKTSRTIQGALYALLNLGKSLFFKFCLDGYKDEETWWFGLTSLRSEGICCYGNNN